MADVPAGTGAVLVALQAAGEEALERGQLADDDVDHGPDLLGAEAVCGGGLGRVQRGGVLGPLQAAPGEQQGLGAGQLAVALVHLFGNDQVDRPELVLEQQEHRPGGGGGALAGDHQAGDRHLAAVREACELGAGGEHRHRQAGPQDRQRVLLQGDRRGGVVGDQPLPASQRAQGGAGASSSGRASWVSCSGPSASAGPWAGAAIPSCHNAVRRWPSSARQSQAPAQASCSSVVRLAPERAASSARLPKRSAAVALGDERLPARPPGLP